MSEAPPGRDDDAVGYLKQIAAWCAAIARLLAAILVLMLIWYWYGPKH